MANRDQVDSKLRAMKYIFEGSTCGLEALADFEEHLDFKEFELALYHVCGFFVAECLSR